MISLITEIQLPAVAWDIWFKTYSKFLSIFISMSDFNSLFKLSWLLAIYYQKAILRYLKLNIVCALVSKTAYLYLRYNTIRHVFTAKSRSKRYSYVVVLKMLLLQISVNTKWLSHMVGLHPLPHHLPSLFEHYLPGPSSGNVICERSLRSV